MKIRLLMHIWITRPQLVNYCSAITWTHVLHNAYFEVRLHCNSKCNLYLLGQIGPDKIHSIFLFPIISYGFSLSSSSDLCSEILPYSPRPCQPLPRAVRSKVRSKRPNTENTTLRATYTHVHWVTLHSPSIKKRPAKCPRQKKWLKNYIIFC